MSIRDLYLSRCKIVDGKPCPTFWIPSEVDYYPICLYSDLDRQADPLAVNLVKRLVALGLGLEIEVGNYVLAGLSKELPKADPELVPLLKSNVSDEARHFKGFSMANATYGSSSKGLQPLINDWTKATQLHHPVAVAGILETGVFLISLGLLRIVGSPSLSRLAMAIAEDEFRHVLTNHAVSNGLGIWKSTVKANQDLLDNTLEWLWGEGVEGVPNGLSLDSLKRYSRELLADLNSPDFDNLTYYTYHNLPFELPNEYMYSARELVKNG